MNERIKRLREKSYTQKPHVSSERAKLVTDFYKENNGKYAVPLMRALNFKNLCEHQTLYIGSEELIIGERGPFPKHVPTFPELTCHSLEDLKVLDQRTMTSYHVSEQDIQVYEKEIIPFWTGKSIRDHIVPNMNMQWNQLYEAGVFTEFMEQRAPGHTTLDGKIYQMGTSDFKLKIQKTKDALDYLSDGLAYDKSQELDAMMISCQAIEIFAQRHAQLAEQMAKTENDRKRVEELLEIARVCRKVPLNKPDTFHEAIQMYWFIHLGTVMELNGWDAMNPGHLDQHLFPFYKRDFERGQIDQEKAKELLECLWIKFNNQTAPPKVGVTALESGTYNDFTNINIGGLRPDGSDGVNDLSYLLLEVIDEIHLLQPGCNIQVSRKTPDAFVKKACELIRKGYGYPSVFNADETIMEMVRVGKTVEDAREGGCSGCIETGAFGKEAYILTGYLNVPKILELTLNNGIDPLSGKRVSIQTGDPEGFDQYEKLLKAFKKQLEYIVDVKIKGNNYIERVYAKQMPAPFLSVFISDCIENAKDYYDGGPRYNTNYIQCCGIGTITDSLSAIKHHVYDGKRLALKSLVDILNRNFEGDEILRNYLINKTPFYGNDEDEADDIMRETFDMLYETIDGKRNTKGSFYHINMLSTTCHVYFGKKLGATPNGRLRFLPESDGTSPSHGADTNGPTAVIKSLSKMDQVKTGGTLLNQRFLPSVIQGEEAIDKLAKLIRTYFRLNGHHIQFNVVDSKTLLEAQKYPDQYRDLLVRVAGYSDYFIDLDQFHQEEIIARTIHDEL
ncbi:MAG TPA: glycyl radical protein [Thermotogota bacterium]|nr:glycyl radical protein [Thermotogota bacterium]HRW34008.1 glycyl radical protein [Thermotogota bacterium]